MSAVFAAALGLSSYSEGVGTSVFQRDKVMSDGPIHKKAASFANKASKDFRWWIGTLAAIIGLYQISPAVGLDLPRWTWIGEFYARAKEVDRKFDKIDSKFADVAIEQIRAAAEQLRTRRDVLQGQLWQVEKEIRELTRAGKQIPESLYRERRRLNNQIEGVKNKLVPKRTAIP